jgi:chromosomal replication initiator protein
MKPEQEIWREICFLLKKRMSEETFSRWIAIISPIKMEKGILTLGVPNTLYQSWLEDNYTDLIMHAATGAGMNGLKILFAVDESLETSSGELNISTNVTRETKSPKTARTSSKKASEKVFLSELNPEYTFENFVIGPSNQLAHASSLAVAHSPGTAYNPLFIYGGSGLGKTHLIQAIGNHLIHKESSRIRYVSCEVMMNEFVDAMRDQTTKLFREKYRNTDTLLIDDIHFLAKTSVLQEEFFNTFNTLFNVKKQIVMTSDRPVEEINGLEQRLVTRFKWGQVVDLISPDFETRLAILKLKQKTSNVSLPEEVLSFIASNIQSNVRLLEGALVKLTSYTSLLQKPITLQVAEELLQNYIGQDKKVSLTISNIQKHVAEFFDIRVSDLVSRNRSANIALPRQVAMFLCRSHTSLSLPEIGSAFGKTHATVIHACKTIEERMFKNQQFKQTITKLSYKLNNTTC